MKIEMKVTTPIFEKEKLIKDQNVDKIIDKFPEIKSGIFSMKECKHNEESNMINIFCYYKCKYFCTYGSLIVGCLKDESKIKLLEYI